MSRVNTQSQSERARGHWDQGFDYAISKSEGSKSSGTMSILDVARLQLDKVRMSKKKTLSIFLLFGLVFICWVAARPQDFNIVGITHDQDWDPAGKTPEQIAAHEKRYEGKTGDHVVAGLYFWTTTTSTIGYGDITPRTTASRLVCSLYQLFIWKVSIETLIDFGTQFSFKKFKISQKSDIHPEG